MMWHTQDGMGWWMVFGGIFWLLFWGSIVYLFFRSVVHRDGHHHHDDAGDPMQIARARLARGEITPQQFEEIARHLRSTELQTG